MNITILVLNIIVLLGVGAIALLAKTYLPSYIAEKGKNLAQKEDIEEITGKMETIRREHLSRIESLKADLAISIQSEMSNRQDEREALLTFFEDCQSLLFDKLATSFGEIPIDGFHEHLSSIRKLFTAILTDYHRLLLYFSGDDALIKSAFDIISSVRNVQLVFKRHSLKLADALRKEYSAYDQGGASKVNEAVKASDEISKNYWDELNPTVNATIRALNDYLLELNKHFKKLGRQVGMKLFEENAESTQQEN